jgi:protein-disulfide isomerase
LLKNNNPGVSMNETVNNNNFLSGKAVPILTVALVILAFMMGSMYTKLQGYEGGAVAGSQKGEINNQEAAPVVAGGTEKGVASVDDDPMLGDPNAKITIIEFSDYECPFCKRHYDQTLPQLIQEYVDTGKARIVYRDFPLSFHDPMATKEAVAANCAREQGGDSMYFEYHDEIFERTTSNGNGLSEADLSTIATDLGLNLSSFNTCLNDPAQTEEVKNDVAAAASAGATGTPSFVVGVADSDGVVDGELLVGAQPFAAFQAVIDPMLQ